MYLPPKRKNGWKNHIVYTVFKLSGLYTFAIIFEHNMILYVDIRINRQIIACRIDNIFQHKNHRCNYNTKDFRYINTYYLTFNVKDKSGLIEFKIVNWYIIHNMRDKLHWTIRLYILYLSYTNDFSNVPIAGLSTNKKKRFQ